MSMNTILFVDDEPNILNGLGRLLHPITEAITMHHYAPTAPEICRLSPVLEAVWHANRICHGDHTHSLKYQEVVQQWQHLSPLQQQ